MLLPLDSQESVKFLKLSVDCPCKSVLLLQVLNRVVEILALNAIEEASEAFPAEVTQELGVEIVRSGGKADQKDPLELGENSISPLLNHYKKNF